jgi:hypothetical protein
MFSLHIAGRTFQILVAWTYKKRSKNKITGYIELDSPPNKSFNFYFLESVVCSAHVLPPTSSNSRYVVQDLYDGDMYLHLI